MICDPLQSFIPQPPNKALSSVQRLSGNRSHSSRAFRFIADNPQIALPASVRGPVLLPPCIRQRPFFMLGLTHAVPRRVFAPQRLPVPNCPPYMGEPLNSLEHHLLTII